MAHDALYICTHMATVGVKELRRSLSILPVRKAGMWWLQQEVVTVRLVSGAPASTKHNLTVASIILCI